MLILKSYQGEVIGLVGENGAGKSTLMKVLAGVYSLDAGTITFKGEDFRPREPAEAQEKGISTIYQELALIPYLTVSENIFLNREPRLPFTPGLIDYPKMNSGAGFAQSIGVQKSLSQHNSIGCPSALNKWWKSPKQFRARHN